MSNPDELPRPTTFDQAITALDMAAGRHPKNRVFPELRERADGGALRSGDLKAFSAILALWRDAQPATAENEPAQSDAEPRTEQPRGDAMPENAPAIELLERVRDALVATTDPFVSPAPIDDEPDPFVSPAPILEPGGLGLYRDDALGRLSNAPTVTVTEPGQPAATMDNGGLEARMRERVYDRDRLDTITDPAAGDGGEPLPKGQPGVAPGASQPPLNYAAAPMAPARDPAATALDPFSTPRGVHRSVSQVTSYHECGMRYRLERLEQAYETPAWWYIGGDTFHETVRWWETEHANGRTHNADDTARKFELVWADQLAKTILENPNVRPSEFRAARAGTEDRDWWKDHGPTMAADYVTGQHGRETEILRLDGDTLALELGFVVDIGGIEIKGFIDQVLVYPSTGHVLVRDHKTGSSMPEDPLQRQVYALGLRHAFGIDRPMWGAYWRARRTSKTPAGETKLIRLDDPAMESLVSWRIAEMDRAERAGFYPVRPSSLCGSCGVRGSCPIMGPPETRRLELVTG